MRMNVACIGMGWWSDVLADAIMRSGRMKIAACYSRSRDKREAFARKYACNAAENYEQILGDRRIEAIINTTPNSAHLETTYAAAAAGKHVFLDKPIANTIDDARALTAACRQAKVVLALGYQRRRESQFRWIKEKPRQVRQAGQRRSEHQPRPPRQDRPQLLALHRRGHAGRGDAADRHPLHRRARIPDGPGQGGQRPLVRLVLPGDNPDVASLVLEHENGALSTLNASYASASEYYLMNIYGKEASAYYDMHQGLRFLKRGTHTRLEAVPCEKNDPIVEELEEFADAVRGEGEPEMDGERGTRSLAVILAGIRSASEGRRVEVEGDAGMKIVWLLLCVLVASSAGRRKPPSRRRARSRSRCSSPPAPRRTSPRACSPTACRASSAQRVLVVNRPGAGGAIGYKYVAGAEARRLLAGVELELDLDHLPLRPARLRLPGVRRRRARAGASPW